MKIGILGTRGIPNNHGGFEQFAEYFSIYLASKNHEVYVYNSHDHPFQDKNFKGVNIIHCYDPEYKVGTAGQFIYDLNCIRDSRKRKFDVLLQLGYTSNSIWYRLLPKTPIIITNMDGMEWKRSKYSKKVRRFLKTAERLAVKSSDYLIADSIGIQDYLMTTYKKESEFIAYGATVFNSASDEVLSKYKVTKNEYCVVIARLEPENNIETIIRGYVKSKVKYPLIIFGGLNEYGEGLKNTYSNDSRIQFVGANYNQEQLNNLRYFSRYYFHGHSVGGTNPSLLEAMASNTLIIANSNIFNRSILNEDALYFDNAEDIEGILNKDTAFDLKVKCSTANTNKINSTYNWPKINSLYENFILQTINAK
jgi:glycosyltransferase involved in cell wall biosynthesis